MHPVEQARHAVVDLAALGQAEVAHRLGHLVAQPHIGVERGKRILDHHLHVAPGAAQVTVAEPDDVALVQQHGTGGRLGQTQDGAAAA